MKITLIVVGIVVLACVVSSIPVNTPKEKARKFSMNKADIDNEWSYFKGNHSKKYKNKTEESYRRNLFEQALKKINDQNEKFNNGTSTYSYGVTRFSDMSQEEFVDYVKGSGLKMNQSRSNILPKVDLKIERQSLPSSIDWRALGLVTPIKDQGACGSCWAFSAISALESYYIKATNKTKILSEQQLVDCVYDTDGCQGGYFFDPFFYMLDSNGQAVSSAYPYVSGSARRWTGSCKYSSSMESVKTTGLKAVTVGIPNEAAITSALANIGPLSVVVYVSSAFQYYSSGVFVDTTCPKGSYNHVVNLVGYGTLSGQDYYILRNSWGNNWGQGGYMYFKRDTIGNSNQCSIATYSVFPVVSPT